MDALFRTEQAEETRLLGAGAHAHAVGAFEGAMYEERGYYRPQADCVMFTRNEVPFCAVCRRALEKVIDLYSQMITTAMIAKLHEARAVTSRKFVSHRDRPS